MLRNFQVSNYKSIKSLSLDMQPFMVLVGPNGAGKTNVVRAMEFFGELLAHGTEPFREIDWDQIARREKGRARSMSLTSAVILSSYSGERVLVAATVVLRATSADHKVDVESEALEVHSESRGMLLLHRRGAVLTHNVEQADATSLGVIVPAQGDDLETHRQKVRSHLERLDELFAGAAGLRLLNTFLGNVFRPLHDACTVTRLRLDTTSLRNDARFNGDHGLGPSGEGLPVVVDRLRGRGATPAKAFLPILAALQEVYPRIEDVVPEAFAQGRVTLNFREKGIKDPIPLDGISDGVLHALALLVALRQPGPGLLAIEEPENALHPWSVRRILERAQTPTRGRAQRQLLITTHSETVVNAVRDPKSLFIVESGKNGTTVVPATTKETALESILKESGQQLGDVWMGGTLGGVPEAS